MSGLITLSNLIDTSVFQPNNYQIPVISSVNISKCCKDLQYAIMTKSIIFIYGDYDVDGLMSMLVWGSVLKSVGHTDFVLYNYSKRTHNIQQDIITQAIQAKAKYVLICDTGSNSADKYILRTLKTLNMETIVIDHHACDYPYTDLAMETDVYNSYEESYLLNGDKVSGAYACLLLANTLCSNYLNTLLPSDAKYFALASMYSDVVDMSSKTAIALYNNIMFQKAQPPTLLRAINKYNYKIGRRFFQYIFSPMLNTCFRDGWFNYLNDLIVYDNKYYMYDILEKIKLVHSKAMELVKQLYNQLDKITYGAITLCRYDADKSQFLYDYSVYTGYLANMVADEIGGAVVCLMQTKNGYKGSLRDPLGRDFLKSFKSFSDSNGHPSAFGIRIPSSKIDLFLKSLEVVGEIFNTKIKPRFLTIPSDYIQTQDDIDTLALYNEFMNTKSPAYIKCICNKVILNRKSYFNKFYNIGLPVPIRSTRTLVTGSVILIEPCICSDTELREVVL